jgi:hypothetical protein
VIALTDIGRATAEGVVQLQEASVADAWASSERSVTSSTELVTPLVQHARDGDPLTSPSNFVHFAGLCDRPAPAAVLLRLITAMRYWRADAHLLTLERAGLVPAEAHALNRLWDAHRDITRVGQGFAEPGRKGVASLEARGLASGGVITTDGIALRTAIEDETNVASASIYDPLDDDAMDRLRENLRAIPHST